MATKFKGCKFDPHDERDFLYASSAAVPKHVDNRRLAAPIRNQGNEGACVGFAVAKAIEMVYKRTHQKLNLSERWTYEHAKRFDEWPGTNYEGSSVRGGMKAAYKNGICLETFWPYRPNRKGRARAHAAEDAAKHKIKRYARVRGIDNIKAAIHTHGVVAAAAMVHEGWFKIRGNGVIPLNHRYDILGGHAFALVGYGGVGFWVANSWGTRWGKNGFAVLSYRDAKVHLVDAWVAQIDASAPAPKVCSKCGRPL